MNPIREAIEANQEVLDLLYGRKQGDIKAAARKMKETEARMLEWLRSQK